jgi:hypothetical protein
MTHPLTALADIIPPLPPPPASPVAWWQSPLFVWTLLGILCFGLLAVGAFWRTRTARIALRRLNRLPPDLPASDRASRAAAILRAANIDPNELSPALREDLDALRYRRDPDPARLAALLAGMRVHIRRAAWRAR